MSKGLAWTKYLAVNGGVLTVATAVTAVERLVVATTRSELAAAVAATAILYVCVFAACSLNLRGRRRTKGDAHAMRPIALSSCLAHPVGSACERYIHAHSRLAPMQALGTVGALSAWADALVPMALPTGCDWALGACAFCVQLACKLLFFELAFDGLFYAAHRLVHLPPLYRHVHKLHHAHTHDVRLLSALQMTAADVVLTHTMPLLGALAVVPLAPGLEMSIAKTYLLFQEFYGHAGVEHRGKNFGIAPWIPGWLGIELRAEDHQLHHVQADVNFSKRFSLFDRLFSTWRDSAVEPPPPPHVEPPTAGGADR